MTSGFLVPITRSFVETDCLKPINTSLTQLRVAKRTPPLNRALSQFKKYHKLLETNKSNNESPTSPAKSLSMKRPQRRTDEILILLSPEIDHILYSLTSKSISTQQVFLFPNNYRRRKNVE
jgi:hypothetical protein